MPVQFNGSADVVVVRNGTTDTEPFHSPGNGIYGVDPIRVPGVEMHVHHRIVTD